MRNSTQLHVMCCVPVDLTWDATFVDSRATRTPVTCRHEISPFLEECFSVDEVLAHRRRFPREIRALQSPGQPGSEFTSAFAPTQWSRMCVCNFLRLNCSGRSGDPTTWHLQGARRKGSHCQELLSMNLCVYVGGEGLRVSMCVVVHLRRGHTGRGRLARRPCPSPR